MNIPRTYICPADSGCSAFLGVNPNFKKNLSEFNLLKEDVEEVG